MLSGVAVRGEIRDKGSGGGSGCCMSTKQSRCRVPSLLTRPFIPLPRPFTPLPPYLVSHIGFNYDLCVFTSDSPIPNACLRYYLCLNVIMEVALTINFTVFLIILCPCLVCI